MKVLLVQPPIQDFYDTSIRTYPLNLLYIAAKIRDLCDVSVVDLRTGRKRTLAVPESFQDLTPFYRDDVYTPFSLFRRFYRFGATPDEIRQIIEKEAPSIVGVSASYTTYSIEALEAARITKQVDKNIVTVMGGTHATLFPQHLLQHAFVDFVIRGDGETPFAHLVESLRKGENPYFKPIDGVSFRSDDHFHISGINVERDIDLLPERQAISSETYRINKKKYTFFLTSRGCPFNCSFCGKPPVPYRKRNIASIERELDECIDLGIEAIDFEDDMLNLDKSFFKNVLALVWGKELTLSAMNGIYSETMDIPLLESMLAAGFHRLNFSLVDAKESVLNSQARNLPKAFLEILPWLESSPFLIETHFIVGLPGQRPEDVLETILFLMGKRLLLGPSIFYLAPGSKAFREIVDSAWEPYIQLMRSSVMFPANPLFPRETTYTLMKLVRFINYVKQVVDRSADLHGVSDLVGALRPGKRYEQEIVRTLLLEKRFTWYGVKEQTFREEPQNSELVELFFRKARGLEIRGFKTGKSVKVDV
ncbi:MAG TPA: radical SAM protein [Syntrophorhabdales bacterium]|nr:radical SAM protein [Syntrophorhabdales bacterium]